MKILAKNKRAYADYAFEDTYDAGLVLEGHEVKAMKLDHVSVKEAVCNFTNNELWLYNMHVPLYSKAHPNTAPSYDPDRKRKLLLQKKELIRIHTKVHKTGLAIVPLQLFEDKNRRIKLTIGVGKLRKKVEKKQIIKERDTARQMQKMIKRMGL